MQILSWVAYIGLAIKTGAILISFIVSFINPDAAKNLYKGLDLHQLRDSGTMQYVYYVSFLVATAAMQAQVWYLVIKVLSKINLQNPFSMEVSKRLEQISYLLFGIWIVGMISSGYFGWLYETTGEVYSHDSGEFIFMAGLVFIISQIFKRGVEIQSENDLTV